MTKRGKWATNAGKSTGGNPIQLAGVVYSHGVGMHAPGGLVIALNGNARRFVSRVGVDDEHATEYGAGSIVFEVWVDEHRRFKLHLHLRHAGDYWGKVLQKTDNIGGINGSAQC